MKKGLDPFEEMRRPVRRASSGYLLWVVTVVHQFTDPGATLGRNQTSPRGRFNFRYRPIPDLQQCRILEARTRQGEDLPCPSNNQTIKCQRLRRATHSRLIKPDPKSHTAAGIGTASYD